MRTVGESLNRVSDMRHGEDHQGAKKNPAMRGFSLFLDDTGLSRMDINCADLSVWPYKARPESAGRTR
jgi:hypothetical protein